MKTTISGIALALLATGACAQQPAAAEAKAVEQFRHIEQACKAAYAKSPRILQADNGAWVRHLYLSPSLSMDVRKTDADGSAYAGVIQVRYVMRPESAATEEAVIALPVSTDVPVALVTETVRFAFQNGKWNGVDIEKVVRLRMKKDGPLEPARTTVHPKNELVRFATPAVDCLIAAD